MSGGVGEGNFEQNNYVSFNRVLGLGVFLVLFLNQFSYTDAECCCFAHVNF